MPPSLRECEHHLVWTVPGAVDEMDLWAFYEGYRADGHGRPAYEPSMMGRIQLGIATLQSRALRRPVESAPPVLNRAIDQAEDEQYGDGRGDELPEQLRTREGRREFFRRARQRLESEAPAGPDVGDSPRDEESLEFDSARIVARTQGRRGSEREAARQLDQRRWGHPGRISRDQRERLLLAAERLDADPDAELAANEAYDPGDRSR